MTSPETPPTPASTPRTGAAGGATPSCGELAAEYADLSARIRARGCEDAEENNLRNRRQVVLARMIAAGCLVPHTRQ